MDLKRITIKLIRSEFYMNQIIEKLKQEARNSWDGDVGEQRAQDLENYLVNKLEEYSTKLNVSKEALLISWEEDRSYSAINYYQEANQPSIKSDKVKVFETVEDFIKKVGKPEFRCPSCNGVSTNPYSCNSGEEMSKDKTCDWKVGGLFGDLGKGVYVFVKDQLKGETLFLPLSWED